MGEQRVMAAAILLQRVEADFRPSSYATVNIDARGSFDSGALVADKRDDSNLSLSRGQHDAMGPSRGARRT